MTLYEFQEEPFPGMMGISPVPRKRGGPGVVDLLPPDLSDFQAQFRSLAEAAQAAFNEHIRSLVAQSQALQEEILSTYSAPARTPTGKPSPASVGADPKATAQRVLQIIKNNEKVPGGIPWGRLKELALKLDGISEEALELAVDSLRGEGFVFEPVLGTFRTADSAVRGASTS